MLLSAVSVLVVAQSSSEIPEGLINNPVFCVDKRAAFFDVKQLIRIVTTVAERVNFLVYVCSVAKAFR